MNKINLEPGQRLTIDQITEYLNDHNRAIFIQHDEYWKGKNSKITKRLTDTDYSEETITNNVIPVPHAAKIAKTVVGYAFKPGCVVYSCEDETYFSKLTEIFSLNNEQIKTAKNGLYMSSRGVSYELHYIRNLEHRFAFVDPIEVIPIWDYSIEPELICVIRYYTQGPSNNKITYIDVYYSDIIEYYQREENTGNNQVGIRKEPEEHLFQKVPFVIYKNNDEFQADYERVKDLIDAYDVLISDSMNEFQKFAFAYLKLVGFSISDDDVKKLKLIKAFENLDSADAVSYLTKDINTDFISFTTKLIEELIFKYAHVYDPADEKFSGVESGISLKYKLFDMETNLISFKESYHKQGVYDRIELINNILSIKGVVPGSPVEIKYIRNSPENLMETAELVSKLVGIVDTRTLLEQLPFIQDVDKVLDAIEEEKNNSVNLDNFNIRDEEQEEEQGEN